MICPSNVKKSLQYLNAIDEHEIFERRHKVNQKHAKNNGQSCYRKPMHVLKKTGMDTISIANNNFKARTK